MSDNGTDSGLPFAVGDLVEYQGSGAAASGRYRITDIHVPRQMPGVSDAELAEAYPEGKAYALWPEGVLVKFGLLHLSVVNVRPASITPVTEPDTAEEAS